MTLSDGIFRISYLHRSYTKFSTEVQVQADRQENTLHIHPSVQIYHIFLLKFCISRPTLIPPIYRFKAGSRKTDAEYSAKNL